MATEGQTFEQWLHGARVRPERLNDEQRAVLHATFQFLHRSNGDYSTSRIASHFLLHCGVGLQVTQIARLVGINPRSAFRHRKLSAKQVGQQIHYHFSGRPYGKLLPRHAGPIAEFLFTHPQATRDELLDFIARTWEFRVSKVALWEFLKKYGLDRASLKEMRQAASREAEERVQAQVLETTPSGGSVPMVPSNLFFGQTQYAGAFLLWPQTLGWLDTARDCFTDDYGSLQQGFLTSVFALIVGLPRVFHLDQMQDLGFALLTGDAHRCPSRYDVGAWRRHVLWNEVDRFCHRTSPWDLLRQQDVLMSFDEHAVPRWTKKFVIPKGYVTTRNKYMRCEKLYMGYDVNLRRFATIKATPGNVELRDVAALLTRRVLRYGQPASLHALFDAGAGKSDANVRTLLDLAEATENLEVTLRACRYPSRMEDWKSLPADAFTIYEEPGVCVGARPKEIRVAETRTVLKAESPEQAVRTIVCRQVIPGPKKDRWHPLYTSSDAEAGEVLDTFRLRQHHEQGYRVQVHDENLNAVPCGYDKQSPDRHHPRFHRGPPQLVGWLACLVYNACAAFLERLSPALAGKFVSTARRMFFNHKADLYCTPKALIVYMEEFAEQDLLVDYIDQFNAAQHRIPWLENRQIILSLSPHAARAGP